jgi:hypothetical protein
MLDSLCSTRCFLHQTHTVPVGTNTLHIYCNGHPCVLVQGASRQEYYIYIYIYILFLCMLSKREMRPHITRLPFLICETCLISTKFSLTSPTRTHGYQLFNIRQSVCLKDWKWYILHMSPSDLCVAHVQTSTCTVQFGRRPMYNFLWTVFILWC